MFKLVLEANQIHKLRTPFTVSASEVRGVSQAIADFNGAPIAMLNHNKPQAYIVPAETIRPLDFASGEDFSMAFSEVLKRDVDIFETLRDR